MLCSLAILTAGIDMLQMEEKAECTFTPHITKRVPSFVIGWALMICFQWSLTAGIDMLQVEEKAECTFTPHITKRVPSFISQIRRQRAGDLRQTRSA